MKRLFVVLLMAVVFAAGQGFAVSVYEPEGTPVHYVSPDGLGVWPYTNWVTAAWNIQDAVDVAEAGDTVMVSNGTYKTDSEITVTSAIAIESVNGPEVTIVDGQAGHRCFNLGNAACTLSGFVIENGHNDQSSFGGGIYCSGTAPFITNCVLTSCYALRGGGCYGGMLSHSVVMANSAENMGGGCYGATLTECEVSYNISGGNGGGACCSTLTGCALLENEAAANGGGCFEGTLTDCVLSNNAAQSGGGSCMAELVSCSITHNSAEQFGGGSVGGALAGCRIVENSAVVGGGSFEAALTNCTLRYNSADSLGGGSCGGTLVHCTLTDNWASSGGGSYDGTLCNCIIWGNAGGGSDDNWVNSDSLAISYSCTLPLAGGTGNVTNAPLFADAEFRLSAGSPCIDAGVALSGLDEDFEGNSRSVDGNFDRLAVPDMGAFEYDPMTAYSDGDVFSDYEEHVAGTDPADGADWFRIGAVDGGAEFQSLENRTYTLECCTNLVAGKWIAVDVQAGSGGTMCLTNAAGGPACYYRVQIDLP